MDLLEPDNGGLEFCRHVEGQNFIAVQYAEIDELLTTEEESAPMSSHFVRKTIEEFFAAQLKDAICSDIRRRLNRGEWLTFGLDETGISIRSGEMRNQIVAP